MEKQFASSDVAKPALAAAPSEAAKPVVAAAKAAIRSSCSIYIQILIIPARETFDPATPFGTTGARERLEIGYLGATGARKRLPRSHWGSKKARPRGATGSRKRLHRSHWDSKKLHIGTP